MLVFQLAVVLLVLVGVTAMSIAQLDAQHRSTEGRRALSVAEYLVSSPGVRQAILEEAPAYIDQAKSGLIANVDLTGSTRATLANADGTIIASSQPGGTTGTIQRTDAFSGRAWTGTEEGTGDALAMAPIIEVVSGETRGVVAVSRAYPSALSNLREALPNLLTYLGLASLLGGLGSYLLSRRLKRQTLGLEPREITGLVEHREALLSGIKEGVVAVDLDGRLTLINEQAATVLGVPLLSRGTAVSRVGEHAILAAIFDPQTPATDRVLPVGSRLVTVSRMPVISRGRHIGWVATLRDRTETLELQRELDLNKSTTDVLRAPAHEFSNRMHVVSGMIALEEYDDVLAYITRITDDQTQLATSVTEHVEDPAVAALLLAKVSRARERHVDFTITPSTRLGRLQPDLSADVNTVVGNLVDNALDAVVGRSAARVSVEIRTDAHEGVEAVLVTVRDTGPGVEPGMGDQLFRRGFSTKAADGHHGRGIGLALVQVICRGRGGDVVVHNDDGAVFVATLPTQPVASAMSGPGRTGGRR